MSSLPIPLWTDWLSGHILPLTPIVSQNNASHLDISTEQREILNKLLTVDFEQHFSPFQTFKSSAKKPTLTPLEELLSPLEWPEGLGNVD